MITEIFETKELIPPVDEYVIFLTSNQIKWWAQETFDSYESGLTRYNELLRLSREFKSDEQVEQQIHFVKIVSKYEEISSEVMMIGGNL